MKRFVLIGLLALSGSTASAQSDRCGGAVATYNTAVRSLGSAMNDYERCVDGSRGKDDCSWRFRALQSKHSDFQDAVHDVGSDCR